MQENRSFDHYFQALPASGQPDVDVAPPGFSNPDAHGEPVPVFHATTPCISPDLAHSWHASHEQYDGGRMNGFVTTSDPGGARAMTYYTNEDLPFYYWVATQFAIADHFHASVLGPTWPNRMFLHAGTSFGIIDDTTPRADRVPFTVFQQLADAGVSWKMYTSGRSYEEEIFPTLRSRFPDRFATIDDFHRDAASGALPSVAWVDSGHHGEHASDEHPDHDVTVGQRFVAEVVSSMFGSPAWPRSAVFLVYDEHGGFYDHVPPPPACPPRGPAYSRRPEWFDRYGFRVPFVVVSPFARSHYVSHATYSPASLLRLIQTRFDLPALTARDANANPLLELFDFEHPAHAAPPSFELPAIVSCAAR